MSEQVQLHVHENTEGWLQISFVKPPAEERLRYRWLHRTLNDWLATNAHVLQEVRPVRFQRKLYGLIAFYDPAPPKLNLEVDASLMAKHGAEYLEAVMGEVAHFIATTTDTHPVLALTNRREITVIVNRSKQSGRVVPLAMFRQRISAQVGADLDKWLAGSSAGFFICGLKEFPTFDQGGRDLL